MIKFLADENLYTPMVEALRGLGYDVLDAKEGLVGSPDDSLYVLAKRKKRILVTMDLDFSNILLYPLHNHYGIIVLRLPDLSITKATEIFEKRLKRVNLDDIKGKVVIIEPNRVRLRG